MHETNMQVTFEFWGVLCKAANADEYRLSMRPGTVADALAALSVAMPALARHLPAAAVALGDRMLLRAEPVPPDARLVLLPPVAGG